MTLVRPPRLLRLLYRGAIWRINKDDRAIYLSFDDGPIPEVTSDVLNILDDYGVKATFFCVGENVKKYPAVYREVLSRGHAVGNHSFNHLQSLKTDKATFIANVEKAMQYIDSNLFRPPHGLIKWSHFRALKKRFRIVMWDLVAFDFKAGCTVSEVVENVVTHARNGSVVVLHDSVKSRQQVLGALPRIIESLTKEGYVFKRIDLE